MELTNLHRGGGGALSSISLTAERAPPYKSQNLQMSLFYSYFLLVCSLLRSYYTFVCVLQILLYLILLLFTVSLESGIT